MYKTDPLIIQSYDGYYVAYQVWRDDVLIKNVRLSVTFKKKIDAERKLRDITNEDNRRS